VQVFICYWRSVKGFSSGWRIECVPDQGSNFQTRISKFQTEKRTWCTKMRFVTCYWMVFSRTCVVLQLRTEGLTIRAPTVHLHWQLSLDDASGVTACL